eukprot:CAMPEP_0178432092 /NCGR_PEP_ID=MMETSP0689_2-20121128/32199_1 /TAXON_ID=160604 /ORGANISM="Amphidinium massartii, Strain CS-259" /LENGTH=622 /DNA_ID=CAMNT_0020054053 /DNA_START=1 /DNA_END=1869 /DNA_ORIENTATION=+
MGQACGSLFELLSGETAGNRLPPGTYGTQPRSNAPVAVAVPAGSAVSGLPVAQALPVAGVPVAQAFSCDAPLHGGVPVAQALPVAASSGSQKPAAGIPVAQAFPASASRDGLPVAQAVAAAPSSAQVQTPLQGRKKSLFIGINYTGQSGELSGCQSDVQRMIPAMERLGFASGSDCQMVLVDDGRHTAPTRENMTRAFEWLISGVQMGDSLFFHYSGHGGREEASWGEQTDDGYHETLVPLDFESAGQIRNVELFELLVRPLPTGAKLTCLIDACHSAGALKLPYLFTGTAENLQRALAGQAVQMAMSKDWASDLMRWQSGGDASGLLMDIGSMGLGLWQLYQQKKQCQGANESGFATTEGQNAGLSIGEVIAFTGCRSDQTSADVGDVNDQFHLQETSGSGGRSSLMIDPQKVRAGGALTSVFLESMQLDEPLTYVSLLDRMRERLESEGFSQVPQLASSLVLDLQCPFALDRLTLPSTKSIAADGSAAAAGASGSAGSGSGVQGFLSAFATPQGQGMIQNARGMGDTAEGPNPYMGFLALGASALTSAWQQPSAFSGGSARDVDQPESFEQEAAGEDFVEQALGGFAAGMFKAFAGGDDEDGQDDDDDEGDDDDDDDFSD